MLYASFSMTIDAPRHPHCRNTGNAVHRLHGTVAFLTREARLDVPLMCKVNKVGKIVNFYPRYRLTIFPVGGQLQNLRTLAHAGYGFVTSHAFTNAGNTGDRCLVGIDMTVLARNLIVRGMYRVTEFDWLNRTAIGEIFALYPSTEEQTRHQHKHEQGWLFRGRERIENRDGQYSPLLFEQEFARKLCKLQIPQFPVLARRR